MVSPVDKNNSDIVALPSIPSDPAAFDVSALEGGRVTYSTYRAFAGAEGAPYSVQYLANRTSEGWANRSISPPQGLSEVQIGNSAEVQFRSFSPDLCTSSLLQFSDRSLAAGAAEGFPDIYIRRNCGTENYEAATTVRPPEGLPNEAIPDVQGMSTDGRCVVFKAPTQLTADAHAFFGATIFQLYESCNGHIQLVSALPTGSPALIATAGTGNPGQYPIRNSTVRNAVSNDGERIYWTPEGAGAGPLYLRENASREPSALSGEECVEAGKACTAVVSEDPARFWAATPSGSAALYTVERGSSTGVLNGELFEYEASSHASDRVAGEVLGIMGASEDLSRIYLVSREALAGAAQPGAPNLYLDEDGIARFIARLSDTDVFGQEEGNGAGKVGTIGPLNVAPLKHSAYVTPDGGAVTFMASASLTGYDNTDVNTGTADDEVYVYDAATEKLDCASCSPSGAQPEGRELLVGERGTLVFGAAQIARANSSLYAPRVLSDSGGQLFFESFEALVPGDVNGAADVYEWEAPGAGPAGAECTEASSSYSPPNRGCLSLISSGQSGRDSSFIDASGDGSDVFFSTIASLVPQDEGQVDIYDAREDGGFAPPALAPAPCVGEACQPNASPPPESTPGTAGFAGPGNQKAPAHQKHKKHKKHKKKHHKKTLQKKAKKHKSARAQSGTKSQKQAGGTDR
jgi:hypothetical protein